MYDQINAVISNAEKIAIIQADNPDGDSLASALALEAILSLQNKKPVLFCGADIPSYLRYMDGWDRVQNEMPVTFDASIIVDTSSITLLESLTASPLYSLSKKRPCIVLDHHATESSIDFTDIVLNSESAVSTGEIIYELAVHNNWKLDGQSRDMIAMSIMSDSLGLISEATTARSIEIISELVKAGVSLANLDDARKQLSRKSPELVAYKGRLLQRVEYHDNNRIATIDIPWEEITTYSPLYNPSMLVIDEMRYTSGTHIAVAFKHYNDGKVTAKIRANIGIGIANKVAEHFGGGGHPYASGFKVTNKPFAEVKKECIALTTSLLNTLDIEESNETVRYTF